MSAGDWSIRRFVALAYGLATVGAVTAGCSAGSSGGEGEAPLVETPAGEGGAPASGGGGGGAVVPEPGNGVIFEPGDVPVPGLGPPGAAAPRRRGLLEKQVTCDGDASTTVSGTVYIPSGELPLYNVMVYVPDAELSPLTPGASCTCEISGAPIVSALTDSSGRFVLENVPVGDDIPLVIQVGDWRRELNIGTVAGCTDNPIPDRTLKLPARRSEGDMPKIAVATGFYDALECLVLKLGVDRSEFTTPIDGGSVQLFDAGDGTDGYIRDMNGGAPFPPGEALWNSAESLQQYDMVLLSCDGPGDYRADSALQGMYEYANLGGRIFASHFQEAWFELGPAPFPDLAVIDSQDDPEEPVIIAEVDTSFPKGQAMSEWLSVVGASTTGGQVGIRGAQSSIVAENPSFAQRWLATEEPAGVQYISANTPLGASDAEQCGRIVLSDIHVSPSEEGDDFSQIDLDFPNGCVSSGLSPQEAVLAFMLFDLSSCIVPDDQAPVAPPIIR